MITAAQARLNVVSQREPLLLNDLQLRLSAASTRGERKLVFSHADADVDLLRLLVEVLQDHGYRVSVDYSAWPGGLGYLHITW